MAPRSTPNRECDFRCCLPSRISIEPTSDDFMHGCVTASEHSVKIPATPSGLHLDPHLEGLRDSHQGAYCDRAHESTLDTRDGGRGHACPMRDVRLAKAEPMADGSHDRAEPEHVHAGTLQKVAYRRLMRRLSHGQAGKAPSRSSRKRLRSSPPP